MNEYKKMVILDKERAKYRRYCEHCGHSIVFPPTSKRDKLICSHCGYYVYKNDLIKFKDSLLSGKRN